MNMNNVAGPRALGEFLRARREQTTLEQQTLPGIASTRRRTRGLRREEVAQLSGISTTWYTWIEQGRDVSVSAATLAHIAHALRLTTAERACLFKLAGKNDPESKIARLPDITVLESVRHCTMPCYLLDITWQLLAWNPQMEHLFLGWPGDTPKPNMLEFMFLHPLAKKLVQNWEDRARRIVAEFRADAIHHHQDATLHDFIRQMNEQSTTFHQMWQEQQVLAREGGERTFLHPQQVPLTFRQVTWQLANNSGIKLIMLMPLDSSPGEPLLPC